MISDIKCRRSFLYPVIVPVPLGKTAQSLTQRRVWLKARVSLKRGGVGAELSAQITEDLFDELDAPVGRVAGLNVVSPFSPVLEDAEFPHPADIVAGVKKTLGR